MTGDEALDLIRRTIRKLDMEEAMNLARRGVAVASIPTAMLFVGCVYGVPDPGPEIEICTNGIDDDRDGLVDCDDPDCGRVERCLGCFDGQDNDGDGAADCSDASCAGTEGCVGSCDDGADDDEDGLVDCNDPDCAGAPACP